MCKILVTETDRSIQALYWSFFVEDQKDNPVDLNFASPTSCELPPDLPHTNYLILDFDTHTGLSLARKILANPEPKPFEILATSSCCHLHKPEGVVCLGSKIDFFTVLTTMGVAAWLKDVRQAATFCRRKSLACASL